MRLLVTAGPTREYIDAVRFITNASSGQMGYAVAAAGLAAGAEVTLVTGPVALTPPAGCEVVRFTSVADLGTALRERFDACDALVMAAAVGDFTVRRQSSGKLRRAQGPITLQLQPTEDLLAGVSRLKRPGQRIIAFAVEEGSRQDIEARAAEKMSDKGADLIIVNTPQAIAAEASEAAILSPAGIVLPWVARPKEDLARQIIKLLG